MENIVYNISFIILKEQTFNTEHLCGFTCGYYVSASSLYFGVTLYPDKVIGNSKSLSQQSLNERILITNFLNLLLHDISTNRKCLKLQVSCKTNNKGTTLP